MLTSFGPLFAYKFFGPFLLNQPPPRLLTSFSDANHPDHFLLTKIEGPFGCLQVLGPFLLTSCRPLFAYKCEGTLCLHTHKARVGTYNGRGRLDGRLLAVAGGAVIGTYTIVGSLRARHVDVRVRLTR